MKTIHTLLTAISCLCLATTALRAQVPQLIKYQGRVVVGGVNFEGSGQFKFALVNGNGTTTFWSNDGTSAAGSQPTAAVALTVSKGLYSVLLGDTALANMTAVPATVFNNSDVRLRVWFNNGINGPQLLTPDQRLAAVGYSVMAATVPDGSITNPKLALNAVQSVNVAPGAVGSSHLAAGAVEANLAGSGQSGVVSGGVVLSPTENPALVQAGYVKIGAMQLSTWQQHNNANAPTARLNHTAVWTGSEMIVWGGYYYVGGDGDHYLNDGGRYNPVANTWTALPTASAPSVRESHTAVWTGGEMIVWGGFDSDFINKLKDGGRYNPATNSWTLIPNSLPNTPAARYLHTAVWTGAEMIIWGGYGATQLNDGGRYSPAGNSWTLIPNSLLNTPAVRTDHTAVWTNSEMIVWGGFGYSGHLNTGGRYNPAGNSWTAVSITGAVPAARQYHTAVWTGSEMIVWGGMNSAALDDGGRYRPAANIWTTLSTFGGAPSARSGHTAVWTGSEMIVWGGPLNDGGRYRPATNIWTTLPTFGAPSARIGHTAVWTDSEMIIWGGGPSPFSSSINDTFSYNPGRVMYLYQRP